MRDENRRVWEQLSLERRRVEKLVGLVTRLWDVVGKNLQGGLPPFPPDLLESESPNIYVTSPTTATSSRFPPPLSISNLTGGAIHVHSGNTPDSSPTATDFHSHHHHHHHNQHGHPNLSRQQSIQHISFTRGNGTAHDCLSSTSTPLQASPRSMSMDFFDDSGMSTTSGGPSPTGRHSVKRPRLSSDNVGPGPMPAPGLNGSSDSLSPLSSVSSPAMTHRPGLGITCAGPGGKKSSRARSESAPLGYHGGFSVIGGGAGGGPGGLAAIVGRPRSGSGLAGLRGVPNIGTMTRGSASGVLPLLTIPTVPNGSAR
ncbi:hypothetical protein M378DRAFT_69691 [Amanita muscaria Koide BX008]|uniref:Uncharacterized protein n=1 Tax=Amanita muscaria (strain Koide BX008) TaxID=946122 RepID=A0A0C2XJ52_AMAMK|nr:hypothetical protein M378DRAFT_69691 [Amanita muscaria Koide BX008]